MKFYNYLFLFIFISVQNCKTNDTFTEESRKFNTFPSKETLEMSRLKEIPNITVDGLLNYKDSLLIIRNAANSSGYHFTAFDLNSKTAILDIMEVGRKENESMAFLSYGIFNDNMWVFDIVKNKFITAQITEKDVNDELSTKSTSTFYYGIQPLTNETFLGTGDYDSAFRATIVNSETSEAIRQIDSYPKQLSRGQKMAYESFLFVNPTRDKAALAARFTDRVQIIDLKNERSTILKGPEGFEPDFNLMTNNIGKEISYSNTQSKYAFVKGKTTTEYVYLLYSGNLQSGSNQHYGKAIFIYNWDGEPVKKLLLPDYILDFAVSGDDSVIYTYNPNNKTLEFSTLSI